MPRRARSARGSGLTRRARRRSRRGRSPIARRRTRSAAARRGRPSSRPSRRARFPLRAWRRAARPRGRPSGRSSRGPRRDTRSRDPRRPIAEAARSSDPPLRAVPPGGVSTTGAPGSVSRSPNDPPERHRRRERGETRGGQRLADADRLVEVHALQSVAAPSARRPATRARRARRARATAAGRDPLRASPWRLAAGARRSTRDRPRSAVDDGDLRERRDAKSRRAPPVPAPASAPKLHDACNEEKIGRAYRASRRHRACSSRDRASTRPRRSRRTRARTGAASARGRSAAGTRRPRAGRPASPVGSRRARRASLRTAGRRPRPPSPRTGRARGRNRSRRASPSTPESGRRSSRRRGRSREGAGDGETGGAKHGRHSDGR